MKLWRLAQDGFECSHGNASGPCSDCADTKRLTRESLREDRTPQRWRTELPGLDARCLVREGAWWNGDPLPAPSPPARGEVVRKAREKLRQTFPKQDMIQAAVEVGGLTKRQGEIVALYLASSSYARIAEQTGCKKATVVRDLQAVRRLVSQLRPDKPWQESDEIFVSRERGERRRSVWRKRTRRIGPWRWVRSTQVTDQTEVRRVLCDSPPSQDKLVVPISSSAMDRLLAALMFTLSDSVGLPPPDASVTASPDWCFNLKWARRRIARRGPADAEKVLAALVRGCRLCVHCRTPILVGCKLNGQTVREDRVHCSAACRQARRRSAKRRLKQQPTQSSPAEASYYAQFPPRGSSHPEPRR